MCLKNILLYILLLLAILVNAQPPSKFYCRYGGNGYDVGYDVKQTLDNGYIITGSTSSFGQGNTDMYLLKLDSMGQRKFETSFGGYSNEIGKSIVQLLDSSFVIVGYTSSTGVGGYDIFLVKADKSGNLVWQKTIGGTDWDFAFSLQATTDGGFIIAGTTYSFGRGNADGYIIKTDANGDITWTKTYGGLKDDEFKSVIQTTDGNYALAGYTKSYNDSLGDAWVFKIGVNGDSIYSSSIGGLYSDYFNNVIELPNNNLYFVGANKSQTNGANTVNWRYSIDNTNVIVVNDFIGNTNIERYNSSSVGINGTIVTVGYNNYMGSYSDANIHVFTASLGYISYNPFGVENTDELFSISKTKDKGFVSIGTCFGNTSLLNDILFVKTDSLGKFGSSIIGIEEKNKEKIIMDFYPNPTNNYLNIDIPDIINYKKLNYQIIDINGRILLSNSIYQPKTTIELTGFASGLYFIQIYNSNILLNSSKISVIK
jgi:hypothetical protein